MSSESIKPSLQKFFDKTPAKHQPSSCLKEAVSAERSSTPTRVSQPARFVSTPYSHESRRDLAPNSIDKQAICHCKQCRKITGSAYSTNLLIPWSNFSVTGPLKTVPWTQEMGFAFESFLCPDCGSLIYKKTTTYPAFKETAIVAAGLLDGDGVFEDLDMDMEIFTEHRANWLRQMDGWVQVDKLPS